MKPEIRKERKTSNSHQSKGPRPPAPRASITADDENVCFFGSEYDAMTHLGGVKIFVFVVVDTKISKQNMRERKR